MEKKKILIIDDEETNIVLLRSMFKGEDHEVLIARDGREGLDMAKAEMPDMILLDVMMPKLDGFKVCALLKGDQRYAKIPIIILSSRAGDDDVEVSKKVGADVYLMKPINKEVLSREIERVFGEAQ